jgi:mannose-6-phosphate isomerase-like protein (cupin superfamily)
MRARRATHRVGEVFDFLSGELQVEFDGRDSIVGRDAAAFTELLREKGLPPMAC